MFTGLIRFVVRIALRLVAYIVPLQKPLALTGKDSVLKLGALFTSAGHKRPLIVTDGYIHSSGMLNPLLQQLTAAGLSPVVFDKVMPNPTEDVIHEGAKVYNDHNCDSVFVVGGGSPMDSAKVIAAYVANPGPLKKLYGILKLRKSPPPLYAVPTTAGTGSEVTVAAVISDKKSHQKKFVIDPRLMPLATALDPALMSSLPPAMTAGTGMDALTHAIEAYISMNVFPDTKRDSELAIKLIFENLPKAYTNGSDLEARENLAVASFLAGYAFMKSGVGYVHAISHQLSAHYDTPHGLANAIVLPRVLRYNAKVAETKLAQLERLISPEHGKDQTKAELAESFIRRVETLSDQVGIPSKLDSLKAQDFSSIIKKAQKEALLLYPVPKSLNAKAGYKILESIVSGNKKVTF